MESPIILQTNRLKLYYGAFEALKGIDMQIPEKQITAFIGPSGCGKSTFLKTLNRMNDLVPGVRIEGEVLYNGRDIFSKEVDVTWLRKKIGMVFQKPNPFPMSIYDNIAYGPRLHGTHSKAELNDLVEKSLRGAALWDEVKDRLKKSALGLSGGQQQRMCIARALAVEPDVLLMDEPTSALDVTIQAQVLEMMVDLRTKKNTALILITHDLGVVGQICDEVAIVYAGEILEYGDKREIFHHPSHPYTKGLFAAIPDIKSRAPRLANIPGLPPDPTDLPKGCCFAPRCQYATEICHTQKTPLKEIAPGHYCSCMLAGK